MSACLAGAVHAASFDERVEELFRPPSAEMIALSPEGRRVAYTTQGESGTAIVIMEVENPGSKKTVAVDPEWSADLVPSRPPGRLRFLRWATEGRLVFAVHERSVPLPPVTDKAGRAAPNPDGPTIISPIMAVDADGKQRGTLVDARDFMETSAAARTLADLLRTPTELAKSRRTEEVRWRMPHLDILGFVPGEREQLILGTHGGYKSPAQYLVDTRVGSVRAFGGDWPAPPGEPQVFDWFRLKVVGERQAAARPTMAWRDEELGRVQRELKKKFPRRAVEILDWSETRARVLVRVTGGSDTGRLFVYQRTEDLVLEIFRRAPWLPAAKLHETRAFECAAPDGARLSGWLTWPRKPRVTPPPLLLVFPSGFPGHAQPAHDPEAQIFADLGFAVARLNHRGVAGVRSEDLNALRAAVDRVTVDDARVVIGWIAAQKQDRTFDRDRVAVLGHGFGGYLALRALQLRSAAFRCGVAFDAPLDLRAWLRAPSAVGAAPAIPAALIEHDGADGKNFSVLEQAEALTNPVQLFVEPARDAANDRSAGELAARQQALGRRFEYFALDAGFAASRPESRAAVYRRIGDFLDQHLPGSVAKPEPKKEEP